MPDTFAPQDGPSTVSTPPPPLRIIIASTQKLWHGGEKQAQLLAEGLRSRGHDVRIVARQNGSFSQGMSQRQFPVIALPGRGRSLVAIWRYRRFLKSFRPDIVLANDGHALTSLAISSVALAIPLRFAARRVDFSIRSAGKFNCFTDGVICVSHAVAKVCRESGVDERLLHIVHDGVPAAFAESGNRQHGRHVLGLKPETQLLLVVSKLTDHKGHRFLLDAMPGILARHPETQLALAGDGELRQTLEQQVARLGLAPHQVRFLGYRHDIPDLLAAADLVVQPSHLEGLCSSLIDAMLAERPIVATEAGGIPDLLETPVSSPKVAWLVPPRDSESLENAVCEALDHPEVAQARANAGRGRALERFTDDTMVQKTLSVFTTELAAKKKQRAEPEQRLRAA